MDTAWFHLFFLFTYLVDSAMKTPETVSPLLYDENVDLICEPTQTELCHHETRAFCADGRVDRLE